MNIKSISAPKGMVSLAVLVALFCAILGCGKDAINPGPPPKATVIVLTTGVYKVMNWFDVVNGVPSSSPRNPTGCEQNQFFTVQPDGTYTMKDDCTVNTGGVSGPWKVTNSSDGTATVTFTNNTVPSLPSVLITGKLVIIDDVTIQIITDKTMYQMLRSRPN